jgi:hypothetical protein
MQPQTTQGEVHEALPDDESWILKNRLIMYHGGIEYALEGDTLLRLIESNDFTLIWTNQHIADHIPL